MAISTYATLSTAINTWSERSYTQAQLDDFITLAEAEMDLVDRGFRAELTATVTLTAGVGTLPTGFISPVSLGYSTYTPLVFTTWDALATMNQYSDSGIPGFAAVSGTQIKVAPLLDGDVSLTYIGGLPSLTANSTNWLLTKAPQAYLFMCLSMQRAFEEDFVTAQGFKAQADAMLDRVNIQSDLGKYAYAEVTMPQMP